MAITVGPIAHSKTCTIMDLVSTGGAGSKTVEASVESDSVLVSLFAEVVSGTLDVVVYTLTESGKEVEILSFPQLAAPTGELVIKKAAVTMSRIKIVATYSGDSTFEVRARGIGIGETSVKIAGADEAKASQKDISTGTPTVLIGSSLTDRGGMVIKNYTAGTVLYVGFSPAETTLANGYPIGSFESLGLDIASGVTVYAVADTGTVDVRLLESGG